jgi:hypothetical protein
MLIGAEYPDDDSDTVYSPNVLGLELVPVKKSGGTVNASDT